ncbi:MAG: hypothetical protein M0Q88_02755 [Bacilli bacterium]|nr:hypothetical protein [Bacilli bacterium]
MKALLVTNDLELINKYENELDITNTLILCLEIEKEYDAIIIDENNLYLEKKEAKRLKDIKEKICIIGYKNQGEYLQINKEEFDIDDIEIYFSKESLLTPIYSDETNAEDIEILKYMEKIIDEQELKEVGKGLFENNQNFRFKLYSYLPKEYRKKLFKNIPLFKKVELLKWKKQQMKANT